MTTQQKSSIEALAFVIPSLVGFLIFFIVPLFRGMWLSLTDWDLFNKASFVGFNNYIELFLDEHFWNSCLVTVVYVLLNVPLQVVFAVFIALAMNRLRSSSTLRSILLIPWLLPNVVIALLWMCILDPGIGIINEILVGLNFSPIEFLTSTALALPSVAGINIWRHMGYTALLVFAGLQGIPKEIYEAVAIDGASGRTSLFKITLPLLRPVLAFVIITTVIGSFQIYDTVAIATKGGPVEATWVLNFFIYKHAFEEYKMGLATAGSLVLFFILIGVSFMQFRLMRVNESDN